MSASRPAIAAAVLDASLVAKWYSVHEAGWQHAQLFRTALETGALHAAAAEQLKTEVIRVLQLGVRDRRHTIDEGIARVQDEAGEPRLNAAPDVMVVFGVPKVLRRVYKR